MLELVGEYEVVLGFLQGYAIGFVRFMGWVLDMYMVILCVVLTGFVTVFPTSALFDTARARHCRSLRAWE